MKEFKEALEMGSKAFTQDLDVVRFVRRIRMHGFGLHFLLGPSDRANAATLAFSRPILANNHDDEYKAVKRDNDITVIKDKWYYIENLERKDKFLIAFFKRFSILIQKF
jgi:hypothetical protein